jgi:hypothetical protein
LFHLERRREGLKMLVATAARVDELNEESRLVLDIAHDPAAVAIRLSALSEDGATEMVRDRLGPDAEAAFRAACHRATGGNPLLLGELLKTMQAESIRPDVAYADAIRVRARPSEPARRITVHPVHHCDRKCDRRAGESLLRHVSHESGEIV